MAMWTNVEAAAPDAILGLSEAFQKDTNPNKVNLGVGVFKDDSGVTPVLDCVKAAEKILIDREKSKSYLPISGAPEYAAGVQSLLFGDEGAAAMAGRARTAHTPGGTGALRLGAELLKEFRSGATVHLSNPTWANHKNIFAAAGLAMRDYPYYDPATKSLDFKAMKTALAQIPAGDIVLLHVCCHNPTGVDLSEAQWKEIAASAAEKGWIPFLDFAYQGFGSGLEEDRFAVEAFAAKGVDFMVASSFSKNFGLYNERTGALTVVADNAANAETAMSHVKKIARVIYSNPPAHGGKIVTTVLGNPELRQQWEQELRGMCVRIKELRGTLVRELTARGVPMDFSFIEAQNGMFSFSGLSDAQVAFLKQEKGIYIVGGGRINVSGLTSGCMAYVCDAIAESFEI